MNSTTDIITKNATETKKLGMLLAQEIISPPLQGGVWGGGKSNKQAIIVSLEGDLGTGKTTFTQGFAEGLGIKEKIQSPTYVILKTYKISTKKTKHRVFGNLIHIDAYRVRSKDFMLLGWEELIKNLQNIILVEWGPRIKKILPKDTVHIIFVHQKGNERKVKIIQ